MPGKFHGERSLEGYSPWGHKESDVTERMHARTHTHNHTHMTKRESTQDKDKEEKGLGRNREASWVYSLKT